MDYVTNPEGRPVKEMRWLFIAPGNLAGDFSNVPNGIAILAAILEHKNIFVMVKDYSVDPLDYAELKSIINQNEITHIGVTMMTCQVPVGYKIANFIKNFNETIVISAGGIHPTILPDESLENGIDIVYRDESEKSFAESLPLICKKPFNAERLKMINGVSFKNNRTVIATPDADRITDLDKLPYPAYHLFKFPEKYTTQFLFKKGYSTNLITSRGCTAHCVFCSKRYQGVYFQSAEKIVEQFIFLRDKYGISQIFIQDDFFTYDLERVNKICDLLIKDRVGVSWVCSNTRADSVTYELFKKMKASGCVSVAFGVESGSESVRGKIGKNLKTEDIINATSLARKAGLLTSAFYIFGHHCETWKDAMDSIKFAKMLNTDTVTFSINCPFPGTPLHMMLLKRGIKLSKDWGKYRTWGEPLFDTDFLNKRQIIDLQKKAYREYYLRPAYLLRQLLNLFRCGSIYMYWRGVRWLLEQYFDYRVLAKARPAH